MSEPKLNKLRLKPVNGEWQEGEAWQAYRKVYVETYVSGTPITDWHGRLVKFGRDAFKHAFTETARYREGMDHDAELSFIRAERMLWIKEVLAGNGGLTRVYRETLQDDRGNRRKRRRVYFVVNEMYVVVLDEPDDAAKPLQFVTAFRTTDPSYEQQIKRKKGIFIEEKKPA